MRVQHGDAKGGCSEAIKLLYQSLHFYLFCAASVVLVSLQKGPEVAEVACK